MGGDGLDGWDVEAGSFQGKVDRKVFFNNARLGNGWNAACFWVGLTEKREWS
jgi:hypothetical protein